MEVATKRALGRDDLDVDVDPHLLRRGMLENDYRELSVTSSHVLTVDQLVAVHRDPFDRLLVDQALCEGFVLLTSDATLDAYGSVVRRV